MLAREQMTQNLWDELQSKAIVVEPGNFYSLPSFVPADAWIWRPDNPTVLEYRYVRTDGAGVMLYPRPLSCIAAPGRVIKVLFRTDRSTTEFLRLLMRNMQSLGYGLDSFGFCGIEEPENQ